jgi:hypothetical protein
MTPEQEAIENRKPDSQCAAERTAELRAERLRRENRPSFLYGNFVGEDEIRRAVWEAMKRPLSRQADAVLWKADGIPVLRAEVSPFPLEMVVAIVVAVVLVLHGNESQ